MRRTKASCLVVRVFSALVFLGVVGNFVVQRAWACLTCSSNEGYCLKCHLAADLVGVPFAPDTNLIGPPPSGDTMDMPQMSITAPLLNHDSGEYQANFLASGGGLNNDLNVCFQCSTYIGTYKGFDSDVGLELSFNGTNFTFENQGYTGTASPGGNFTITRPDGTQFNCSAPGTSSTATDGTTSYARTGDASGWPLTVTQSLGATVVSQSAWYYKNDGASMLVRKRCTTISSNTDRSPRVETQIQAFYGSSAGGNLPGQLYYVVSAEGVKRFLAANLSYGVNPSSPSSACTLDDTTTVPDSTLCQYADAVYLDYDSSGRVTSQKNVAGCSSCAGGGGDGMLGTYSFAYGSSGYAGTDTNTWATYRQSTDPSGLKTVDYYNVNNQVMFHVVWVTSTLFWTDHYIFDSSGRTTEHRTPSACIDYQWGGGTWPVFTASGGSATVNDSDTVGVVEVSDYDGNGNLQDTKVRNGTGSGQTTYWKSLYTYGSGGTTTYNSATVYRPTAVTTYAADDTSFSASDASTITYDYAYYKTDGTWTTDPTDPIVTNAVAFIRTTYPTVSTSHNGLGSSNYSYVHYHQVTDSVTPSNNVYYQDWSLSANGRVDYTQQYRASNQTKFSIEDVQTDSSGHVSGYTEDYPLSPGTPGTLTSPTDPWTSTQWKNLSGMNRVTSYVPDEYGRTITVTTPDGIVSQTAYMSQNQTSGSQTTTITEVTLTAPVYSSGTYNSVPVTIDVQDLAGQTVNSAAGNPTSGETITEAGSCTLWTVDCTGGLDIGSAFQGTLKRRTDNVYGGTYDYKQLTSTVAYPTATSNATTYTTTYSYYTITDANPGMLNETTSPDGTITKKLYDSLGRTVQVEVGTADANLETVSMTFFDGDTAGALVKGGSGNVTEQDSFFAAYTGSGGVGISSGALQNCYAYKSEYDWQNRTTASEGPDLLATVYTVATYDSGQGADYTRTQVYYDSGANFGYGSGDLRAQSDSYIDEMGQNYLSIGYDVGSSGTVGDSMSTLMWYDSVGRTIKTANANGLFQKMTYDNMGETIAQFTCYDSTDSTYSDAGNVTNDNVLEETTNAYDPASGDLLFTTSYQRIAGNTTQGDLSTSWSASVSRATYQAFWYDSPTNRLITSADYGTNGGTAMTARPAGSPPGSSSSGVHVSLTGYDDHDRANQFTNPNGIVTVQSFNDLDMATQTIENFSGSGVVGNSDTVLNRTTNIAYDSYGRQSTLVAKNPKGASMEDQTTTYNWGVSSGIHRNDLLASVTYPDTHSVSYSYDVMGRKIGMTDQNATTHNYVFDSSGRFQQDIAYALGGHIDGTIRRIQLTYDDRDRATNVTSYDSTSGGTVKNEVKYTYADGNWGQVTEIQQNDVSYAGDTGTQEIDYAYADGHSGSSPAPALYLRRTSATYPGPSTRRVVYYNYLSSGDGAVFNRLDNIASASSSGTVYASYTYLGAGTISQVQHAGVTNNLVLNYDPSNNGSFSDLDQFGQVTNQNWQVNSSTVDAYQYAYDYNGNRNYRANTQSTAKSDYYTYDGLDRLTHVDHGTLNGGKTAISTLASAQDWALDELGNWSGFKEDNDGNGNYNSSGDLDQSRAHSIINETGTLTANYGASWVTPLYDNASSGYYGTGAGNMTDMPIPGNETVKESAVYDAWNRMVEIEDHTGAEIAAYAYNGLNYRVQKVDYSQSPHVTTDYIYNENWQALEEQRTVTGHSIFTYIQYVWDPRYIDAAVCRFRDANSPVSGDGTLEETLYYCNDANMNVTALVDASGTVDERYTYDAYGQVHMFNGSWTSIGTTSAYDNQILFGGYRYDPESGLYHVRNRMYHPTLGRWMSRDLLGYGDSMDLYQYVVDSPTYYTDESGDQAKTPPPPPASRPAAPAAAHDSTTPAYTVSNPWQEVDNSTGTYQVVVTWANPPFTQAILVQKVVFTVSGTSTAKGVPTPVTVDQVFEFHDQSHVATTGSEFSLTYSEAWTFDGSDPTEYISVESEKGWSDKDNKDYFSFAPPSCSSGTAKWSTQAQWTTKADQMATVMKDEHSYPPEHPFNRNTDWAEGFVHMAGTLRSRFGDSGFATGGASRTFEIAWCNQPTCTNGLTTGRIKVTSATSTPENTDWNKSVGRQ